MSHPNSKDNFLSVEYRKYRSKLWLIKKLPEIWHVRKRFGEVKDSKQSELFWINFNLFIQQNSWQHISLA